MKITDIQTIPIRSMGKPAPRGKGRVIITPMNAFYDDQPSWGSRPSPIAALLVQITTDTGLTGIGSVGGAHGHALYTIEHHLKHILMDRGPFDVHDLWERMYRETTNFGRKGIVLEAISGLDMALWDIMGKATNQSVYNLLGGKTRSRIRAYASRLFASEDLDALAAEAQSYLDQGFTAMKQRFAYGPRDGQTGMRRNLELVRTVREVVGPDIELAADAFMGWDVNYAIRMIRMLEDAGMDLAWVEEPLSPDNLPGYARITAEVQTPISGGEHEYTRYGFREIIEQRAVDIVQLDVSRVGGITEARRIWAMAAAHDLPVYPHGGRIYNYHLIMAHHNSPIAEYFPPQPGNPYVNEYLWHLWDGEPIAEKGYITLSDKPGLGVDLNEETVETYRAQL